MASVSMLIISAELTWASRSADRMISGEVTVISFPAYALNVSAAAIEICRDCSVNSRAAATSAACAVSSVDIPENRLMVSAALTDMSRASTSTFSPASMPRYSSACISTVAPDFSVPKLMTVLSKFKKVEYPCGIERKRMPCTSCVLKLIVRPWKSSRSVSSGALHTPIQRCCSTLYKSTKTFASADDRALSPRRAVGDSSPPFSMTTRFTSSIGLSSITSASSKKVGSVQTYGTLSVIAARTIRSAAP